MESQYNFNSFPFVYFRMAKWIDFFRFVMSEFFFNVYLQPIDTELNVFFDNKKLYVKLFMLDNDLGYGIVKYYKNRWRFRAIIVGSVEDWQDLRQWRRDTFGREG